MFYSMIKMGPLFGNKLHVSVSVANATQLGKLFMLWRKLGAVQSLVTKVVRPYKVNI
jgi:hypothetical protein